MIHDIVIVIFYDVLMIFFFFVIKVSSINSQLYLRKYKSKGVDFLLNCGFVYNFYTQNSF